MKIAISIKNYERKYMLVNLLSEVNKFVENNPSHEFSINIYDDKSKFTEKLLESLKSQFNFFSPPKNFGKSEHWKMWDWNLKNDSKNKDTDLFIYVPSDFSKINFEKIISLAEEFKDEDYIFNIANDGRRTCWNKLEPIKLNDTYSQIFFSDCSFFTNYKTLSKLDWTINPIPLSRFRRKDISSGVGQQFALRLNALKIAIYHPNISLAHHGDHESTMHPSHRKKIPLITNKETPIVDFYIEQHPHYQLGNFVSCTPVIRELFEIHKQKIPVLFASEYVKQCYLDNPYIEIIDFPRGKRLFGSELINRKNDKKDIDFIQEQVLNKTVNWNTFISEPKDIALKEEYGVFINGSGSEEESYLDRKLIPTEIQKLIKDYSPIKVIGIGSNEDKERNIFDGYYGDMQTALSYIKGAKWVISNVTGFYHVAGALNKRQLVLWKNCLRPKNENMNMLSFISEKDNWADDIKKFFSPAKNKKIVIGIATFSGREKALQECLKSLRNQTIKADEIFIYDNSKEQIDLTDNGKFEPLSKIKEPCYYFSCDDDLIYPTTYIESMLNEIKFNNCIVTHHGRKLRKTAKSYYKGHLAFGCLRRVSSKIFIDVAGTGVTAFDTEYFSPAEIYKSEHKRMADCIFSLEASKQRKKILLLPHKIGYIKQIPVDSSTSCFEMERKNPIVQNSIADEIFTLNNK